MRECSRHAYQVSYAAGIANDKAPCRPKRVMLPTGSDEMIDYAMNTDFDSGILSTYSSSHGQFDFGCSETRAWTASGFKQLESAVQPLCCCFVGGGVMPRIWNASTHRQLI